MSAFVKTFECYPSPLTLGGFVMDAPEPDHERCPGGHHIPGVIGGWDCPCPCHKYVEAETVTPQEQVAHWPHPQRSGNVICECGALLPSSREQTASNAWWAHVRSVLAPAPEERDEPTLHPFKPDYNFDSILQDAARSHFEICTLQTCWLCEVICSIDGKPYPVERERWVSVIGHEYDRLKAIEDASLPEEPLEALLAAVAQLAEDERCWVVGDADSYGRFFDSLQALCAAYRAYVEAKP